MKNMDQIRAKNALEAGRKNYQGVREGEVVKKIPPMIRENGILGALAFAVEKSDQGKIKNHGFHDVFQTIIDHLNDPQIRYLTETQSPDNFLVWLTLQPSSTLRAVTSESLAYLNYLRRLAGKKKEAKSNANGH